MGDFIIGWENNRIPVMYPSGIFATASYAAYQRGPDVGTSVTDSYVVKIDASRVAPTAVVTRPRAYGVLACVYLGIPVS